MKLFRIIKFLFHKKPKFKAFPNNEVAVEAFRHHGKIYYHFENSFKIPPARAFAALAIYEELRMRCTKEYIEKHIQATELLLNPSDKRIRLNELALINHNLKERLSLAPFPDHIYKLASVVYFDENESPFSYDFEYNKTKIDEWKKDPEILNFFLTMPFQDLMPFGNISSDHASNYFRVTNLIDQNHQQKLRELLSKES